MNRSATLDIESLPSGNYIIEVTNNITGTRTFQMITKI